MTLFHLMVVPQPKTPSAGELHWFWTLLIWMVPFLVIYLWHWWHDHRHNHILEKRLKEIVERLDRILANSQRESRP